MKNKIKFIVGGAVLGLVTLLGVAATVVGTLPAPNIPVVNGQTYVGNANYTNGNFFSTNGLWPPAITNDGAAANVTLTYATNVTALISPTAGGSVTFQLTAAQVGTASGNATFILGRNVQGGSPTNNQGGNLNIEWFSTVSLPLSTTSGQQATMTTNFTVANYGAGAYTTYYLQAIGVSNNMILTNYQVYASAR